MQTNLTKTLTTGELKKLLDRIPNNLPVFFRRVAPICGNIEEASSAILSNYSSFGIVNPCLIVEPFKEDDEA